MAWLYRWGSLGALQGSGRCSAASSAILQQKTRMTGGSQENRSLSSSGGRQFLRAATHAEQVRARHRLHARVLQALNQPQLVHTQQSPLNSWCKPTTRPDSLQGAQHGVGVHALGPQPVAAPRVALAKEGIPRLLFDAQPQAAGQYVAQDQLQGVRKAHGTVGRPSRLI